MVILKNVDDVMDCTVLKCLVLLQTVKNTFKYDLNMNFIKTRAGRELFIRCVCIRFQFGYSDIILIF